MEPMFGFFQGGRVVSIAATGRIISHRFEFAQFVHQLGVRDGSFKRCERIVVALLGREFSSGECRGCDGKQCGAR
ncbi:hypothetical protein AN416_26790 [Paraburkholderia caribensis]|nr:hypothetical protein AN416_26790 [Paraburkholderia caribensis]AMV45913.1 hypothetical protein ATN79_28645 [Paraburkholderia caribensis]